MRIQFTEDREVRNHLGVVEQSFRAGQVVELSTASARRWLRRHAAFEVNGDTPIGVHETVPEVRVVVHPPEPEAKPDPFEESRRKELGGSPESGQEPSSASPPAPASQSETANTSDAQEPKADAGSSSSTEHGNDADGPTASTQPTPVGGGRRRTRRASKG